MISSYCKIVKNIFSMYAYSTYGFVSNSARRKLLRVRTLTTAGHWRVRSCGEILLYAETVEQHPHDVRRVWHSFQVELGLSSENWERAAAAVTQSVICTRFISFVRLRVHWRIGCKKISNALFLVLARVHGRVSQQRLNLDSKNWKTRRNKKKKKRHRRPPRKC